MVGLFVVTCSGHSSILCSFLCDVWDTSISILLIVIVCILCAAFVA